MWFTSLTVAVNVLILIFRRKRLSGREIYLTWIALAAVNLYTCLCFGLILDLYDFGAPNVSFVDLFFQGTLGPSMGVVFCNFMPRQRKVFLYYLIGWVIFSVCYEWITLQVDFLRYKGWKLWYSSGIYVLVFLYLRLHMRVLKK